MSELQMKRTYAEAMALRKKLAQEELARAQAPGGPVRVSRMAAAIYLNVHYDTLREWEKTGRGPPVDTHSQSGTKLQEAVYYIYEDLVAWASLGKRTPTQREKDKKHALKMRDEKLQQEEIRMERELEAMRQKTRKMEIELEAFKKKGLALGFASIRDLMVEQDWAFNSGKVLGPVLRITDEEFVEAIEQNAIIEATLDQVLLMPWVESKWRRYYKMAYFKAIEAFDRVIQAESERQELDERLPNATNVRGRKPL